MKKATNALFLILALMGTLFISACGVSGLPTGTLVFNLSHPGEVVLTTSNDVTLNEVAQSDDNLTVTFEVPCGYLYTAEARPDDDSLRAVVVYDISVAPGETTEKSIDFAANTAALEDAIAELEAAIAALESALTNGATKDDLEALQAELLAAIDAIAGFDPGELEEKIDELLERANELLEDVMNALEAVRLDLKYTASLNATCIDPASGDPIADCLVTETGIDWSEFPAGDDFPRTCPTGADGTCVIKHLLPASDLLSGESLRFRAEAVGYASTEVFLDLPANRPGSFQFHLSANQPDGTLDCADFLLESGEVREDVLDLTFVWEGGVKRALTQAERDAASCVVLTGVEYFSIDPSCLALSQVSDGCGTFEIDINGMKCTPSVRAGDTGFCGP